MPSRWLSSAIVAFWLATTGWLFWHDLWPNWRPGEPPPFYIDLVEEVQKTDKLKTFWTVTRNKDNVFQASTWIDYHKEQDTFALHSRFSTGTVKEARPFYVGGLFKVTSMFSEYRVNRTGQLRSLRAEISVLPEKWTKIGVGQLFNSRLPQEKAAVSPRLDRSMELKVLLWGEVRGEQFHGHCRGSVVSTDDHVEVNLPPAPVSHNGSILMPLHPVNRIYGLRAGQNWRQPLVDPFRDAFNGLPGVSSGVRHVNARVISEPQILESKNMETACLVIEYESEGETTGRTWVERDTGLVQRQEALLNGDHWVMQRDTPLNKRQ